MLGRMRPIPPFLAPARGYPAEAAPRTDEDVTVSRRSGEGAQSALEALRHDQQRLPGEQQASVDIPL